MNIMQRSASWLGTRLKTAGGRAVIYRRGTKYVAITATPQMHTAKVLDKPTGLPVDVEIYSWTITASDLIFDGEQTKPREGDVIDDLIDGEHITWHVLPIDENRKAVEWLDSSGLLLLVHTKRV